MKPGKSKCPHCSALLSDEWIVRKAAEIQGSKTSDLKAQKSRENGRKGGRPPKKRVYNDGEDRLRTLQH